MQDLNIPNPCLGKACIQDTGYSPKVGDLIADIEYGDLGVVIDGESTYRGSKCYRILNTLGRVDWFSREYILESCCLISANTKEGLM